MRQGQITALCPSPAPRARCNAARWRSIHKPTHSPLPSWDRAWRAPSAGGRGAGAWGNLSSLDGFGRAASTATATATAAPGVVLCVADGIVRIVVHLAAGEDLGGRLRRKIDRLIGVAAGERERRDRKDDAEPLQRPPLLPE